MQRSGIGSLPEYGAIFMSNSETKNECLARQLFGLPPKFGPFVKKIKAGMILFLFEHEKRKLHGVFEADSDGAINIVPKAFSSSGFNFSAQVQVKSLWNCDPLSESEFHEAINENYFTPKKFNFGLSEVQVTRLLHLFGSKKIKVPQRLTDEGVEFAGGVNGECVSGFNNTDIEVRSATTTGYLLMDRGVETGHSKYQFGDVPSEFQNESNNGFGTRSASITEHSLLDNVDRKDNELRYRWSEHCPDTELHSAISAHHPEYYPEYVSRVPGSDRFSTMNGGEFRSEYCSDNGLDPSVLSKYPSMMAVQSKLGRSVLSGERIEIRNPSPIQTTTKSFPIKHQMQERILSRVSPKESYRDTVVMGTHSYGSVVPRVDYPCPSVEEVNYQPISEGYKPYYDYSSSVVCSSTERPFLSHEEPKGMTQRLDKLSTLTDHASFSGPSPSEYPYRGNPVGLSQAAYSKSLDPELEKKNCYDGLYLSKYSLAEIPSLRTRTHATENSSSCYTPTPGCGTYPSLLDAYGYQVEPEDLAQNESAARKRKRESLAGDIASASQNEEARLSSVNPPTLQHYEHNLLEYNQKNYQSSDALYNTKPRKSRTSVFSRLASARDAHVPEHNPSSDETTSKSVDDIMETLRSSHHQWVKSKKPKQVWRQQDDAEKFTSKRQTAGFHGVIANRSKRWANDKTLDSPKAEPDRKVGVSLAGSTKPVIHMADSPSLFNFKRRSASSRSEAVVSGGGGGPLKKRKLVRPDFGVSCDNKDVKKCASISPEPAEEDNAGGSCEASIGNQYDKNTSPLRSSNASDRQGRSCVEFQNAAISSTGQGENLDILQDEHCSDSAVQQFFSRSDTRHESGANECERNTEAEVMEMMNCSYDQFNKLVKEGS